MLRRNRQTNARLHLIAEDEGKQQLRPAHLAQLGEREQRRGHRRGRMDHGAQMRVTEIMDIGRCRVEEGGAQRIDALGPPDHGRGPAARKFGKRGVCDLDRLCAATRQRHRKQVDEGALGLMANLGRNVLPPRCRDIMRKHPGDIRLLQHASSRFGGSIGLPSKKRNSPVR